MTTITIELPDITAEQLEQQNISEEQLTTIARKLIQLYLSKPHLWEGLRDLVTILFDGHQTEPRIPNSTTLQALEQARTRQVEKFDTLEDLFNDLEI
jgi:hypothetical protein